MGAAPGCAHADGGMGTGCQGQAGRDGQQALGMQEGTAECPRWPVVSACSLEKRWVPRPRRAQDGLCQVE